MTTCRRMCHSVDSGSQVFTDKYLTGSAKPPTFKFKFKFKLLAA